MSALGRGCLIALGAIVALGVAFLVVLLLVAYLGAPA